MQPPTKAIIVNGLRANPSTCWDDNVQAWTAIDLLQLHPSRNVVRALSTSLLDALNAQQFNQPHEFWGTYYGFAARLLSNPDYPGARYIAETTRAGLLVHIVIND